MIQTLGPPPSDTLLTVEADAVDVSANIAWVLWLNMIHQILENIGMTFRKVVDVTFPPCPPNSSIDVDIAFLGVKAAVNSGDLAPVVTLGLSGNTKNTANNGFLAFVKTDDVVTIREFCVDPFGIGPFTDTFTIMIATGEANTP